MSGNLNRLAFSIAVIFIILGVILLIPLAYQVIALNLSRVDQPTAGMSFPGILLFTSGILIVTAYLLNIKMHKSVKTEKGK